MSSWIALVWLPGLDEDKTFFYQIYEKQTYKDFIMKILILKELKKMHSW